MTGLGSSCGACKFLRRRCTSECIFAPYFSYDHAATHFSAVHKVFGASNVSKLLLHLPAQNRSDAAITLSYEALARMQDPIYGCVAYILALQKLVANLEEEIEIMGNQMANIGVDAPKYVATQETNVPNDILQHSSGYTIVDDLINQQSLPVQQPGNLSANQAFSSQMNMQFPQGNLLEDEIFQAYSDSSVFNDRFYEELNQDNYLQPQWMCSTLNSR